MNTVKNIDINKEVNPAFSDVWYTEKPYIICKGGRNSFKSSTISLKLAYDITKYTAQGEMANVIILRKAATTIRDSVFLKIKWALEKLGVADQYESRVAPFKWVHRETGSAFFFYGQDDFEKLKSSAVGNVIAVWYEEAAEFNSAEEFDQTNITFMRQVHKKQNYVKFYWSYNPPRNPYSWINKWAEERKELPDYLIHTSTYKDDRIGFVTQQMAEDIKRVKANDYDYYRYLYLGEPVGLGTNVYNFRLFQKIKQLDKDERIMFLLFGLDAGHQQSATACICAGVTNRQNLIILGNWYYSPLKKERKLAPDELARQIKIYKQQCEQKFAKPTKKLTIDSAEGALRNQYYKDYGERWNPVKKKKKVVMIDYIITLLAQGRLHVLDTPENELLLEQHRDYRWDEKTVYTDNPRVVEEDDHLPDALQYLVTDNLRELGLVW